MSYGTGPKQDLLSWGQVARQRAAITPLVDGIPAKLRTTRYGELVLPPPTMHGLVDEGSYFVATNPTIDTAVAYAVAASFSDTVAALLLKNNSFSSGPAGGIRTYLHYLRIAFTGVTTAAVAPASAVAAQLVARIDSPNTNRTPSANASGRSPFSGTNQNGDDGTQSQTQIWEFSAGALTVPASSGSVRTVGRAVLKPAIPVLWDELLVLFGQPDAGGGSIGTSAGLYRASMPAIDFGPQETCALHLYFPSNATTAAKFEYELGYWER